MKYPYRFVAKWYDKKFEPLNSGLRVKGLKMFPPEEGMYVLDIGCGIGVHLKLYQKAGCNVFGIDISPSMLKIAKNLLGEKATLNLADAAYVPYPDNTFDLVYTSIVFHEMLVDVRSKAIMEAKRVLKKDGRILIFCH